LTRHRFSWLLGAAIAANLGVALAVWTRQPWAGGPAEWRWEYLGSDAATAAASPAGAGLLGALGAIVASVACLGWLSVSRRAAAWRGVLPLAIACGLAFTFGLVAWQPGGFAREMAALVSRNGFGYVWDAALAPPNGALLADYPAASADLNQHSVTHPPGPLLLVHGLDALGDVVGWRALPATPATTAAAGASRAGGDGSLTGLAAAAIEREAHQARRHGRPVPLALPSAWTVTVLAVMLPALSALAGWPLFGLAIAWGYERRAALLAVLLWMLVPARSLFTPSLDQALPVLVTGAAWLAAAGGRRRAAAAGVLLFAACFASYGCLAVLPLVAVCAFARNRRPGAGPADQETEGRFASEVWPRAAAMALGFGLPYLLLALFAGHDPWHAMRAALALHHRIAIEPRSYATWLLWNPYDFALLLSPAVLGLAAAALVRRRPAANDKAASRPWRLTSLAWWCLLALLLLSGSVRGEAGRIWLAWMPFASAFAAAAVWRHAEERDVRDVRDVAVTLWLASQGVLALVLAARMAFVS
jgi:hypothetical protein